MHNLSNGTPSDPVFDPAHLCRYSLELSPQPMVAVEGQTYRVCYVNAAFERLAEVKRSALLGRLFAQVVPEGSANRCLPLLERVYRTGTPERMAEPAHGGPMRVYWSYAVWAIFGQEEGGDQRPVGLMIQVTDATEAAAFRRQAAEMNEALLLSGLAQHKMTETAEALSTRLQAALLIKDHFLAVLSHELRNPLTPVLATAAMLRADLRFDADTREQLEVICRNAELEAHLIDDLLDVTRIERGKVELHRERIDLGTVLRRAVEVCQPDIEARHLEFGVDAPGGPWMVDADPTRLQHVFWNLLNNAIKFTPLGGCVGLRCGRDGDGEVVVEVNDSGEGIEPEAMVRIFNAFEQAERSITRQFGGLGLGLAISKGLVEMHGGTIHAASAGQGKGATFTVRLPLLADQTAVPVVSPDSAASPQARTRRLRILLVEDHGDTARIMKRILTADGHEVEAAADVATALALAGRKTFDLLLSDLGLPDGSGTDLMRALRARGSTLPGIALSGYGQETDIQQSREAGFATHLTKPVSLPKLEEAMIKVVGDGIRIARGSEQEKGID